MLHSSTTRSSMSVNNWYLNEAELKTFLSTLSNTNGKISYEEYKKSQKPFQTGIASIYNQASLNADFCIDALHYLSKIAAPLDIVLVLDGQNLKSYREIIKDVVLKIDGKILSNPALPPEQLTLILNALIKFDLNFEEEPFKELVPNLFKLAKISTEKNLSLWRTQSLLHLVWLNVVYRVVNNSDIPRFDWEFVKAILKHFNSLNKKLSVSQAKQLFQIRAIFWKDKDDFPSDLYKKMQPFIGTFQEEISRSKLENKIARKVKEAVKKNKIQEYQYGVFDFKNTICPDCGMESDFSYSEDKGIKFSFQIDGSSYHCYPESEHPTMGTRFRDLCLTSVGWEVVVLNEHSGALRSICFILNHSRHKKGLLEQKKCLENSIQILQVLDRLLHMSLKEVLELVNKIETFAPTIISNAKAKIKEVDALIVEAELCEEECDKFFTFLGKVAAQGLYFADIDEVEVCNSMRTLKVELAQTVLLPSFKKNLEKNVGALEKLFLEYRTKLSLRFNTISHIEVGQESLNSLIDVGNMQSFLQEMSGVIELGKTINSLNRAFDSGDKATYNNILGTLETNSLIKNISETGPNYDTIEENASKHLFFISVYIDTFLKYYHNIIELEKEIKRIFDLCQLGESRNKEFFTALEKIKIFLVEAIPLARKRNKELEVGYEEAVKAVVAQRKEIIKREKKLEAIKREVEIQKQRMEEDEKLLARLKEGATTKEADTEVTQGIALFLYKTHIEPKNQQSETAQIEQSAKKTDSREKKKGSKI